MQYNKYYVRTCIAYEIYISVLSTHHKCKQKYKKRVYTNHQHKICIIHVNKASLKH